MGDLPGLWVEPMSPALAGGFFTTEAPGKPGAQGSLLLIGMCPKGRGEGCFTWGFADSVLCKGSITLSSLSYKSMLPQSSVEEVPIKY